MLTKNDLQQIGQVVDDKFKPVKKQLNKVQKDLETVIVHFDKRLTKVEKDVKELQQN